MSEKKPAKDCNHRWQQMSYWRGKKDRRQADGPKAKCTKCDGIAYFTWSEWNALPKETRTELNP